MKHKGVELIFEDEHLLAVNKPGGLLSIPDRYDPDLPNLKDLLDREYASVFTVHRLDRETSGIILFARTEDANRNLQAQFREREIHKEYLAIIDGSPATESGVIEYPITAQPGKPGRMMVLPRGKPSVTEYEVKERFRAAALLSCQPLTGRTHQIRVHLREIGHPLLVDAVYGPREEFFLSEIKRRKFNLAKGKEERPLLTRIPLHAHRLQFNHPATGKAMDLECPLPKDMRAVLNQLRKWAAISS